MSLSLRPLDDSGFGAVVDSGLAIDTEDLKPQLTRALHQHRQLIVPPDHATRVPGRWSEEPRRKPRAWTRRSPARPSKRPVSSLPK